MNKSISATEKKTHWQRCADRWPSAGVARTEISKFTGGALTAKHCANLDALGLGIPGRIKCGSKVIYPMETLVPWLEARTKTIKRRVNRTGNRNEGEG